MEKLAISYSSATYIKVGLENVFNLAMFKN